VSAGEQVAVPAQDRFRQNQQPQLAQYPGGQAVHQRREERPVRGFESGTLPVELALQHTELMPQSQDLDVLVVVGPRQQSRPRDNVGHSEVGESEQHDL
jgi:hypothetical protein